MSTDSTPHKVPLIYPFMLVISVTVAALFCYLYLTSSPKPSETNRLQPVPEEPQRDLYTTPQNTIVSNSTENTSKPVDKEVTPPTSFTLPSSDSLPGEVTIQSAKPASMPLAKHDSLGSSMAYEQTNYKVQHILDATFGDSEQDRLVVEVPVIYQTRGMRWGPEEIAEARRVLRAMEIYRERVKQLKTDGVNIQTAWESLLTSSQPTDALRADSPSLPSNFSLNQDLSNSSESITISNE